MSCKINIEYLSDEKKDKINKELQIKLENSKYAINAPTRYIFPYEIEGDDIHLPFAYAYRQLKLSRPNRDTFSPMNVEFEGTLRDEQSVARKEVLKLLSGKGSALLCSYPGWGKTCTATNIACTLGFKTLTIVNKIILMKQWEESILKFCPTAKIQRLTTKSKFKPDCDFYIINATNVCKMGRTFFKDIGTVIVDEAHMIMAEKLSKSLQYIYPRYLLGLTATPYRLDGLDVLLDIYFGKYKIIRELVRTHIVYKTLTGFKPKIEKTLQGRVNWGVILDSQANDERRNQLIISIVQKHSDRTFLILTKRLTQGEYLVQKFQELGEDVTSLLGTQQDFELSSRILVATSQKAGVGFDHPKLDALLLAGDLEAYFIQYLGRVFRTKDVKPIIFDLVDNNKILEDHFNSRQSVYIKHGGTIKNYLY